MGNNDYVINWQKRNKIRVRMHKLNYYYRHKIIINTAFSKEVKAVEAQS